MTVRLTRFPPDVPLVEMPGESYVFGGTPTVLFRQWWQSVVASIENLANDMSGTYTPTLTNVTNVTASTAYTCQWFRVGDVVTVSGKIDITPTAAGLIQIGLSLPVASALTSDEQCAGAGAPHTAGTGLRALAIRGDAANDRAILSSDVPNTTVTAWYFQFSYRVI